MNALSNQTTATDASGAYTAPDVIHRRPLRAQLAPSDCDHTNRVVGLLVGTSGDGCIFETKNDDFVLQSEVAGFKPGASVTLRIVSPTGELSAPILASIVCTRSEVFRDRLGIVLPENSIAKQRLAELLPQLSAARPPREAP